MKQENPVTVTLLISIFIMLVLIGGTSLLKQGGVLGIVTGPGPVRITPTASKMSPTPTPTNNPIPSNSNLCFELYRVYKNYCSSSPSTYPTPHTTITPTATKYPTKYPTEYPKPTYPPRPTSTPKY